MSYKYYIKDKGISLNIPRDFVSSEFRKVDGVVYRIGDVRPKGHKFSKDYLEHHREYAVGEGRPMIVRTIGNKVYLLGRDRYAQFDYNNRVKDLKERREMVKEARRRGMLETDNPKKRYVRNR